MTLKYAMTACFSSFHFCTPGKGCGSLLSGPIFQEYGAVLAFRGYGISAFVILLLYCILNFAVINRLEPLSKPAQEEASVDTAKGEYFLRTNFLSVTLLCVWFAGRGIGAMVGRPVFQRFGAKATFLPQGVLVASVVAFVLIGSSVHALTVLSPRI